MHIPVMAAETIKYLAPQPHQKLVDCTLGEGGHAKRILEQTGPTGRLLAIDWDKDSLDLALQNLVQYKNQLVAVVANFKNLKIIAQQNGFEQVEGILLDLGMSSWQLMKGGRGFSFQKDEPLDMRYNRENPLTAQMIVGSYSQEQLADIFFHLADEKFSRLIAQKIIEARKKEKIVSTKQLADLVEKIVPRRGHIHPATRVFQALRMEVNKELDNLLSLIHI